MTSNIEFSHKRIVFMLLLTIISIIGLLAYGPIAQPQAYHEFADSRRFFNISNFADAFSNFGLFIVGLAGLYRLIKDNHFGHRSPLRGHDYVLFSAILLTSIGSAYYHLNPDNMTLFWDRLPMAIGFMALFSLIIGEYISMRYARSTLMTGICIGIVSVLYWRSSEMAGAGDLRLYILVQFLSIALIVFILASSRRHNLQTLYIWFMLLFYAVAKICEMLDSNIFDLTAQTISGHTLKHIFAAIGIYFYWRRCRLPL